MEQSAFRVNFISKRNDSLGKIQVSLFKFYASKNNPSIDLFCFVEGYTDSLFYEGILPTLFQYEKQRIAFIFNDKYQNIEEWDNQLNGKRSVIKLCDYLVQTEEKSLCKCKFIVDRDYDDADLSRYDVPANVMPFLTILPCYSIENYYFTKDNLKSIFRIVFGSMEHLYYDEFYSILYEFLSESCEYSAFKKLIVKFSLASKYDKYLSQVLSFKDEDYEYLIDDGRRLIINVNLLKSIASTAQMFFSEIPIYESKLLTFSYRQYCTEMKNDPLIIKGKLLFGLLLKYINCNSNEQFTSLDLFRYSRYLSCPGLYLENN